MKNYFSKLLFLITFLITAEVYSQTNITLVWDANKESDLIGYNLYQGTNSGKYDSIYPVNNTNFVVSKLSANTKYYFALTAVNSTGLESFKSVEVSYTPTNLPVIVDTNFPTLKVTPIYTVTASIGVFQIINGTNIFETNYIQSINSVSLSWENNYTNYYLQYSTNLINWQDSLTLNTNPAIIDVTKYNQLYFILKKNVTITVTNDPFKIYAIYPVANTVNTTISKLTNIPPNSLIVATVANESTQLNNNFNSSPSLNWVKRADANAASSGDAEIWTANYDLGGNLTITNKWGTNNTLYCSTVYYVITGADTNLSNFKIATGQNLPSVSITTTKTNSLILAVSSDWAGVIGPITYLAQPTFKTLTHSVTNRYQATHWYKNSTNLSTYIMGESAPTGQKAGTIVLEVRSK